MKNIIKIIAVITIFSLCLTGCGFFVQDDIPAIVEITTTSGESYINKSFNGLNMTRSGSELALHGVATIYLQDEEEVATIRFYCTACGHDEVVEVNAPFSKMFECDCPVDGDKNYNSREYYALRVNLKTEETVGG